LQEGLSQKDILGYYLALVDRVLLAIPCHLHQNIANMQYQLT